MSYNKQPPFSLGWLFKVLRYLLVSHPFADAVDLLYLRNENHIMEEYMKTVDILAFGAHPDDVELGVGGILACAARSGQGVAVVDLTRGEMASGGTASDRDQEADQAGKILKLSWRHNMNFPDRGIVITSETSAAVAGVIRLARPRVVLAPYYEDRHPDHVKASQLIKEACFDAGLMKILPGIPVHRPPILAYYSLNKGFEPTVVKDVTHVYKIKMAAIMAHKSQFSGIPLGIKKLVQSRDSYFGSLIGVEFGEGLLLKQPLVINDITALWSDGR